MSVDPAILKAGIFQGVDDESTDILVNELISEEFPRGRIIFHEGDDGDKLYIIGSGKIKLTRRAADRRENLITIMGPSDMFGELSLFDPGPRTSSAITLTKVTCYAMTREALMKWTTAKPDIAQQLIRVLARRLRRTNNTLADLIFTDVPGRVAKAIIELSSRFGVEESRGIRVVHDLTQEELAQLIGASRETVNKALADFTSRGWISLVGKTILITNLEKLQARTRF